MSSPPLHEWFRVEWDGQRVTLQAEPPGGEPWSQSFAWERITRICFLAGGPFSSDELYVFTDERPESYVIPTEARGGLDLIGELMARGKFPPEASIEAATLGEGEMVCWPPA